MKLVGTYRYLNQARFIYLTNTGYKGYNSRKEIQMSIGINKGFHSIQALLDTYRMDLTNIKIFKNKNRWL